MLCTVVVEVVGFSGWRIDVRISMGCGRFLRVGSVGKLI